VLKICGVIESSDERHFEVDQRLLGERRDGGKNYNSVVIKIPFVAVYFGKTGG
jgi:hypothetical protein